MFEAVDAGMDRVERVGVAKMGGDRDALVNELDDGAGRIGRHREVDLDAVNASFEQAANLLGNGVHRGHAVKQLGKRAIETLDGSVEQWTKDKEARPELSATVEVGAKLQHLLKFSANVSRRRHACGEEERQTFLVHQGGVDVSVDQAGEHSQPFEIDDGRVAGRRNFGTANCTNAIAFNNN